MLNECKFCLNHGPVQGLSGDIMQRHKVHGDKSNSLFLLHKRLSIMGGHPPVICPIVSHLASESGKGGMVFANNRQA